MDRLKTVLLFAGLGCFALAFALSGFYPWIITDGREREATLAQITAEVSPDFIALKDAYPVQFTASFDGARDALTPRQLAGAAADDPRRAKSDAAWQKAYADAVFRGRNLYISEACWHCHSQYVRPAANEEQRFGRIRTTSDDNNVLQRPVLWGTRRVGPDLTNEGGLRSNDWHVAHFHDPKSTSPGSVMPAYTWYFVEGWQVRRHVAPRVASVEGLDPATSWPYPGLHATKAEAEAEMGRIRDALPQALEAERDRLFVAPATGPSGDGLALIAYLQWLGTWTAKGAH